MLSLYRITALTARQQTLVTISIPRKLSPVPAAAAAAAAAIKNKHYKKMMLLMGSDGQNRVSIQVMGAGTRST